MMSFLGAAQGNEKGIAHVDLLVLIGFVGEYIWP
jgi:hypothetical protein